MPEPGCRRTGCPLSFLFDLCAGSTSPQDSFSVVPALVLTIASPWLAPGSSLATLVIPPGPGQNATVATLTSQSSSPLTGLQLTVTWGTTLPPGVALSVALQGTTLPPQSSLSLTMEATIPPSLAVSTGVSLIVRLPARQPTCHHKPALLRWCIRALLPTQLKLLVASGHVLQVRSAEGAAIQAVARVQAASTQLTLAPASMQVCRVWA